MGAIARWRALTRGEKILVARAAGCVAVTVAGVRLLGAGRLLARPKRAGAARGRPAFGRGGAPADIAAVAAAVDRAGRYVPGATCLTRSLALARMLGRRGVSADVRLGVRTAGGFHAHAWVEVGGVPLTGRSEHEVLTSTP